jgi:hypothetical protein
MDLLMVPLLSGYIAGLTVNTIVYSHCRSQWASGLENQ